MSDKQKVISIRKNKSSMLMTFAGKPPALFLFGRKFAGAKAVDDDRRNRSDNDHQIHDFGSQEE
ncbi:MAG: hypothetical protein OD817_05070, partial [Gammaproteobacteria bacterium]